MKTRKILYYSCTLAQSNMYSKEGSYYKKKKKKLFS